MAAAHPSGRRRLRRAIETHLGSAQVSRVVHGSIIGLALVLVLEAHGAGATAAVGSLLATALALALAELYSDILGTETRTRRRITGAEVRHVLVDAAAAAFGVAFSCVFLLLAIVELLDLGAAFALAKWTGLGLIGGYGFASARMAGAGTLSAVLHAGLVALAGGLLIAVKALVH